MTTDEFYRLSHKQQSALSLIAKDISLLEDDECDTLKEVFRLIVDGHFQYEYKKCDNDYRLGSPGKKYRHAKT